MNSVVVTALYLLRALHTTNYSVSYIVKNETHTSESTLRLFTIINCRTVYYLGRRG